MRFFFITIILIQGLIHLVSFAKTFFQANLEKQVLGIPSVLGAAWLIIGVMFFVVAASFYKHQKWFYLTFITILISQCLILISWQEAKFGTIFNSIILFITISLFYENNFQSKVQKEVKLLFSNNNQQKRITKSDSTEKSIVPEIVQRWIKKSGILTKGEIHSVQLTQKGKLRLKPNGKWKRFKATQYFNIKYPGFIWVSKVQSNPVIKLIARDQFTNGKGEMLVKLASMFPVVNEHNNEKINSASAIRFLSEVCWFPSAALNNYFNWKKHTQNSAIGTFKYTDSKSVSGIFTFDKDGNVTSFEAKRFFGSGKKATQETWVVKILDTKVFDGVRIPSKCSVHWEFEKESFNWLSLEITDINYNCI